MPHEIEPALQRVAQRIRRLVWGQNVLFHGTRYPRAAFDDGRLRLPRSGPKAVCFSRSAEEAVFWATLWRQNDEGRGAVLIFDRDRLSNRYSLRPRHDDWGNDEQEEAVWGREVQFFDALLGCAPVPESVFMDQPKKEWAQRRFPNEEAKMKVVAELDKPGPLGPTSAAFGAVNEYQVFAWRRMFRAKRRRC